MIAYWERDCEWMGEGLQLAICPSFTGPTSLQALDVSGRSSHGTLTNMDRNTAWQTSGGKGALNFNVSNHAVRVNTTYTRNAISMSVWIKIGAASASFPYPMQLGTTSAVVAGIGSDSNSANIRWVLVDGGGASICDLSAANPANAMSHFCGTWNGSTAALYRNGDLVSSTTSTRTLGTGSNVLYVGSLFGDRAIFGQLDDSRIYERALTASEVRQMYERDRGGGMLYQPPKRRSVFIAAGFRAYWHRRQSQLIGGGL